MEKSLNTESLRLKHIYQEYERLHSLWDSYSKSSFDDFKLLGAVGLMLAWGPIAKSLENIEGGGIVFFGFIGIIFVIAIIGTRDLLKQSIIIFNMKQTKHYEKAIRSILQNKSEGLFCISEQWQRWFKERHRYISGWFYLLCLLFSVAYPTVLLGLFFGNWGFAVIYLSIGVLLSIGALFCINKLYPKEQKQPRT